MIPDSVIPGRAVAASLDEETDAVGAVESLRRELEQSQRELDRCEKRYGTNTDIAGRKKAEALLAGENRILEMVATGKPLAAILEELCCLVDSISTDSMASVLLVDSANCLRNGAAPGYQRTSCRLLTESRSGRRLAPAAQPHTSRSRSLLQTSK